MRGINNYARVLLLISFLLFGHYLSGQIKREIIYPEVSKPCPDFDLTDVQFYSKKQLSLKDFRGQWLILDFWNKYCGACVASFPKINQLNKKFEGRVQFLLVGYVGSQYTNRSDDNGIRLMYEKFRIKLGLDIPIVYDSILFHRFGVDACPYILVIDDKGIVRGITYAITQEDIRDFLAGREPILPKVFRTNDQNADKIKFDSQKPFLINGNGGVDTSFLFRSVLSEWKPAMNYWFPSSIDQDVRNGKFQVLGEWLYRLYNYAYFGKGSWQFGDSLYGNCSQFPICEMSDSLEFKNKKDYCYSVIVPPVRANKIFFKKIMQNDLQNYFGYDVQIEMRRMPYWKLVATDEARRSLLSKGNATYYQEIPHAGFTAKNYSIYNLLSQIWAHHQSEIPFIDETGIAGNIDITIDAIMTDLDDIKKALQKNGLDLVKEEKEMEVIVIRDAKKDE